MLCVHIEIIRGILAQDREQGPEHQTDYEAPARYLMFIEQGLQHQEDYEAPARYLMFTVKIVSSSPIFDDHCEVPARYLMFIRIPFR